MADDGLTEGERMIRRVSTASGPILFAIALACTIRWIA